MKVTTRDLLWLVALAAVLAGWFDEHQRQAASLRSEAHFQQWHYKQLAAVLETRRGAKTTVNDGDIAIRFPNASAVYYPRPPYEIQNGR